MKLRFARVLVLAPFCGGCRHLPLDSRPVAQARVAEVRESGVRIEAVFVGDGREAVEGDIVDLEYVAKLGDGTEVVSTIASGRPVSVTIGSAFVRGLDEGLLGIRAHGRRNVIVPASLAYGTEGVAGLIPPDATLHFELHALEIRTP